MSLCFSLLLGCSKNSDEVFVIQTVPNSLQVYKGKDLVGVGRVEIDLKDAEKNSRLIVGFLSLSDSEYDTVVFEGFYIFSDGGGMREPGYWLKQPESGKRMIFTIEEGESGDSGEYLRTATLKAIGILEKRAPKKDIEVPPKT